MASSVALSWVVAVASVWSALLLFWVGDTPPADQKRTMASTGNNIHIQTVIRVIDGHTVVISAPYLPAPLQPELRVCGVDKPEKGWRAGYEHERIQANRATAFVQDLLSGSEVAIALIQ